MAEVYAEILSFFIKIKRDEVLATDVGERRPWLFSPALYRFKTFPLVDKNNAFGAITAYDKPSFIFFITN